MPMDLIRNICTEITLLKLLQHIPGFNELTHWGWVTHICVDNLTIIGSDNGLSPGRRQAIIWTNAGVRLIGTLETNFIEIIIEIRTFSFKKMHLKMSSGKWRPLFSASMCQCITQPYVHSCSKVMEFFFRWQNMVFIFKVHTWNFVCGIRRSFSFTMENILSVWYTATPGWTSKFGKVWKTRCQNAATRANIWRCFLVSWDDKYLWVMVSNNRHDLYFCSKLLSFSGIHCFFGQIRYLNIRHERTLTSSPLMLKCSERCRETQEREPAHTGWCLVIQPQKFPRYFEIGS